MAWKRNPHLFTDNEEEAYSKVFPQRPEGHEETYSDIPDWAGGCPDCPHCGVTMGYSYLKSEFKCPECGYTMDEGEWDGNGEPDEDEKPYACVTCGGPWPDCRSACKLFDN